MRKFFTILVLPVAIGWCTSFPATGQTVYFPATVTGYNADVVADGSGPAAHSTTSPVDRGTAQAGWCFANTTFIPPAGQALLQALPATGFVTTNSIGGCPFQLAPATGNNSLRLDGAGSGTLVLSRPQACTEVAVLATESNGSILASNTFTVNFTDGSSQVFSGVTVPDWLAGPAAPFCFAGNRVNLATNAIDAIALPRLYQLRLPLAAGNYGKRVQSVGVSKASAGSVLNVMGVSLGNVFHITSSATATCAGSPVVLTVAETAPNGSTYQWQEIKYGPLGSYSVDVGPAQSATCVVRPLVTTSYWAKLTSTSLANFSAGSTTITVLPHNVVVDYTATPGTPILYCQTGQARVVNASPPGGRFSSSPGLLIDSLRGTIDLDHSVPGAYQVAYTVMTSCMTTATTQIFIAPPVPSVTYPCPPFYKNIPQVAPSFPVSGGTFSAAPGLVINPATGVVNLAASMVGRYVITYTSPSGCTSTTPFEVVDAPAFPNVITPNGDTQNEALRPNLPNATNYHLQVYSRWGRQVFDGTDPAQGWTATDSSPGRYYYQLEYTDCAGTRQSIRNWVEVVK